MTLLLSAGSQGSGRWLKNIIKCDSVAIQSIGHLLARCHPQDRSTLSECVLRTTSDRRTIRSARTRGSTAIIPEDVTLKIASRVSSQKGNDSSGGVIDRSVALAFVGKFVENDIQPASSVVINSVLFEDWSLISIDWIALKPG